MLRVKMTILSVMFAASILQSAEAASTTTTEFEVNGEPVRAVLPFDGVSVTDSASPLFKAFSQMAGPGVRNVAVILDNPSFEAVQSGRARDMEMYVTVGVQSATVGRAGPRDLNGLKAELRRQASSDDMPKLSGAAASGGMRVSGFDAYGIVRDDARTIAMVSATEYSNSSGEVVQETTVGTMFVLLHGSVVNVAVIKQEASDSAAEAVEEILKSVQFDTGD